ncbi:hypothetical protein EJ03DRAFT_56588 [Teratosphaeria nubilosa]|uniref:Uncharacterized protein n=1 Tax=Teratosphaeria nubilosa TaxID=161662 RepID=A0A6G1LE45_9PEZI|nr:hypothetical protein EJ03DRAFT_56588 [Teratosphaeria nubilosa]
MQKPAVDPDALGPPGWDALDLSSTVGCDAAGGEGNGATGSSSKSFSTERTYYTEDHGLADVEDQPRTRQATHAGAVNAHGLSVKSFNSYGPASQPPSHSLGQPVAVVEDDSYEKSAEHPVRMPNAVTSDWYSVQEQESMTSCTAAESQRTAAAQDQASMDRLVLENQSLRLMLATALKTGDSTKTTDARGSGQATSTVDATSTPDSMKRHLKAVASLVEAERNNRVHLVNIYDQELNRTRGKLAAAVFCIEDTRYVLGGFAKKMSQFGSAAFESTAAGSVDITLILKEEKAKRNALSSFIDERLEGLAERLGRPDTLCHRFATDVDKLNAAIKMQKQGCARKCVDLSEEIDLLATNAGGRKASLQSWR